jgi:hypothetical protein
MELSPVTEELTILSPKYFERSRGDKMQTQVPASTWFITIKKAMIITVTPCIGKIPTTGFTN